MRVYEESLKDITGGDVTQHYNSASESGRPMSTHARGQLLWVVSPLALFIEIVDMPPLKAFTETKTSCSPLR